MQHLFRSHHRRVDEVNARQRLARIALRSAAVLLLLAMAVVLLFLGIAYYSRPWRESRLENQPITYYKLGGTVALLGIFFALAGTFAAASFVGRRLRSAWRGLGFSALLVALLLLMTGWGTYAFILLILGSGCLGAARRAR